MNWRLTPEPLTREAFAPFGDVIETAGCEPILINEGLTERYHALATVDPGDGRAVLSIFRTRPRPMPILVKGLERHPLGSQAFIPLRRTPFLALVAEGEGPPDPHALRLFISDGSQGVNYRRGVWHHYHLTLELGDFLVVDREGAGENLEQMHFPEGVRVFIDLG